jgi:hypothetical protein
MVREQDRTDHNNLMSDATPLATLAALGVEATIIIDTNGSARVKIGNDLAVFRESPDEAIRAALAQRERS